MNQVEDRNHWAVVVVGGGPAGLMAGARTAARGHRTLLLEKNVQPGAKLVISGGGRCNVTHHCDARGIIEAVGPGGKFLHSALAAFSPQAVVEFFRSEGVPTYVESDTGKIFPKSNQATDILGVLLRRLHVSGCELAVSEPLVEIEREEYCFRLTTTKRTIYAEKVLLATGGKSYPACGTVGDGYRFAEKLGHTIVPPHTALAPLATQVAWVRDLQGITLPDVRVRLISPLGSNSEKTSSEEGLASAEKSEKGTDREEIRSEKRESKAKQSLKQFSKRQVAQAALGRRGALLFAHFGLSGPAVMDLSREVSGHPDPSSLILECDLVPDFGSESLEEWFVKECAFQGKRLASGVLDRWVPHRVGEIVLRQAGIPPERRIAELSKSNRSQIVRFLKHLEIPLEGTLGFRYAEVTAGGVSLDEVDSRTMESKKVQNLYFSGELLDLDGPIGGYNLQIAFSTGYLAGERM